mmetsp:Transcript_3072/g.8034  ORF Transcript_3072/g.8034 Transcript_3072/m.8034 type:complete len:700 (-) Transcript_3072:77-2176(-)
MRMLLVTLLALPALALGTASPVQKVVSLLSDLQAKITKEGEEAKATYEKFTEWCEDRSKNTKYEITTAKSEIATLKASIDKSSSLVTELTSKVEELAGSISGLDADIKAAVKIREDESADFAAAEKELVEIVDALQRAIGVLQREAKKKYGSASALLQLRGADGVVQAVKTMVEAAMIGSPDARTLTAFVQNAQADSNDDSELGAPAAAVYESQGGGIIETLEGLLDKAEEQLDGARKKETTSRHNFEMLKQSLEDESKFSTKDLSEAKVKIAAETEAKKTSEGDLAMTAKSLDEDETVLSTLKEDCMKGSEDYQSGEKARADELKALADALKVLRDMTGGADGVVYGGAASFLQIAQQSSLKTGADLANFEAVRFVRKLAQEQHSEALAQLARRMSSAIRYSAGSSDPFAKVKGLIEDMIARLERDAQAEASHKAYCDKEMGATQAKIDDLTASLDQLTAKVDKKKALSVTLKGEVQELQAELAELARSDAEMHEARREGHAAFVTKKADLEQGLTGVRMALKLLREYYSGDDGAEAFVQQPDVPEYHKKSTGAGQGILGMLEVVESDFGRGLAQAEMDEDSAATEYEKISMMNKLTKATKEQDVKYKTKEAASLDKAVAELASDREGAQTELDAVLEYSKTIRSACVAKPQTYEERKARREAEVAGLKEALEILEGEAVLLQRKQHGLRGAAIRLHA